MKTRFVAPWRASSTVRLMRSKLANEHVASKILEATTRGEVALDGLRQGRPRRPVPCTHHVALIRSRGVNFQVTVLKILVSYPDGFAVMEDLKRDMAILATSGREWADRTKRLAARVPDLDIFSHGLVERVSGGWQVTSRGRAVLEFMETRPAAPEPIPALLIED